MKNYDEMTDFEINCLVAEATGHRPLISQYGWKGSQEGNYTAVVAIGPNGAGSFDWCNDPVDAFPIIDEMKPVMMPIHTAKGEQWNVYWGEEEKSYGEISDSLLRAAMVVFLMKHKDGK